MQGGLFEVGPGNPFRSLGLDCAGLRGLSSLPPRWDQILGMTDAIGLFAAVGIMLNKLGELKQDKCVWPRVLEARKSR